MVTVGQTITWNAPLCLKSAIRAILSVGQMHTHFQCKYTQINCKYK